MNNEASQKLQTAGGAEREARELAEELESLNSIHDDDVRHKFYEVIAAFAARCANEARLEALDWAIKSECARCRESYPQRHDEPSYIPNFGGVQTGDWTHPCTADHDWRYCQAAKIHEAIRALKAAHAPLDPPGGQHEN